ncbi:MAG: hypothetical protein LBH00_11930 [Planctomycetaceae bacterium]|nr:hypothetical protein [Planctomycetaceae bacterium]
MRRAIALIVLLLILPGCVPGQTGQYAKGGFYQTPYNAYGVDGPGPGVMPEFYQPVSLTTPDQSLPPSGTMLPAYAPSSQVNFVGPESAVIHWDARVSGTFDSAPFICPGVHDFVQGNIYRLKLRNIPAHPGQELYPTLEIAPTAARTQAFLAHSAIPIEFTDTDFDQVFAGNFITKVVYLPNPEYQGIAATGVGTLVNTQLQPGMDPIVEAGKRGAILAVVRMGNKDLSQVAAERRQAFANASGYVANMPAPAVPAYPTGTGTLPPQNLISGVNIPPWGTPMTKTTTGVPGPPQLPTDAPYLPNRSTVIRAEPIIAPPAYPTYIMPPQPNPNPLPAIPPVPPRANPEPPTTKPHFPPPQPPVNQ